MWFWKKKKVDEEEELKVEEGLEASVAGDGDNAEAEEAAEAGTDENTSNGGIDEEWGGEDAWDMGEDGVAEEVKEASASVDAELANGASVNALDDDAASVNAVVEDASFDVVNGEAVQGLDEVEAEGLTEEQSEGGFAEKEAEGVENEIESAEDEIEGAEDEIEGADADAEDAAEDMESGEGGSDGAKAKEKKGFFARLKEGLAKTRDNIVKGIDRLFSGSEIDDDFYEELEEILIMGDIGVNATTAIIERLKEQVKEKKLREPKECKELLIQSIREQMEVGETAYDFETKQSIIMVIGVNGVGKTTTVGKLAWKLKDDGKKVLIAAADTFRAAAGDQLAEWARRAGVPMIGGKEGADPASVVFDAVNAAKARNVDVLLIDTAGRLHNKKNLMEELRKMNRIIDKEYPDAHRENLIVLDGTTGQNALAQAREFGDVTNLTGIVLTKMDGTAKGGIAVAIQSELGIPVKYIGVGETTQDLQKFDPDEFVRALFDVDLSEDLPVTDDTEKAEE